ncbi:DNA polymerase III subunit gamma/tau [Candidatus Peregrinibacteria bacterium]|nr:DNA polymerase III subunit gamma/tau [Candidatus Peregrinibacteria bacterium]
MSLYLKYRPQDFKTVVGQDHVVQTVQNALKHGALSHAYLFAGPRGTGKTSMARIIAKALNCLSPAANCEPCNQCAICEGINQARLVDLIEIDAASNRGIDEIRDLREKIVFAPSQAKTKVYIIDEVHMLTKEAFNALLKTLEEPPSHAYFILATTEAHKIPETIVSRCQQFTFKRIGMDDIVQRLKKIAIEEKVEADADALKLIARIANGGLRDAIGLFEQMVIDGVIRYEHVAKNLGLTGPVLIETFFRSLMEKEPMKALAAIHDIHAQGQNLIQFTAELIAYLREQMLLSLDKKEHIAAILRFIDIFSLAKQQIPQAIIPQLPLEVAAIKACGYMVQEPNPPAEKKEEAKLKKRETKKEEIIPAAEPAYPETTGAVAIKNLTIESVRENWQRILDHIETPFIRMSFMDSEPVKFEDGALHLAFTSATFKDKIAKATNQAEVHKALERVFGGKITIKLELKKMNLKPDADTPKKKEKPNVITMAEEVFGQNP